MSRILNSRAGGPALAGALLVVLCVTGCQPKGPPPNPLASQRRIANPPSFVIVLGDEIGCGDLGCGGQKHTATPNIDRLAKEGVRLTEFYAGDPNGAASLWCLLRGRDVAAAEGKGPSRFALRAENATLADTLLRAGYDTCFVGPWTVGGEDPQNLPDKHGFTEWSVLPPAEEAVPEFPATMIRGGESISIVKNADGKQGQYLTEVLVGEAEKFLDGHQSGSPFLLVMYCPIPATAAAMPALEDYAAKDWSPARKCRAARITEFDRAVGSLLAKLRELKVANQTAVMVTSCGAPRPEEDEDLAFFDRARKVPNGDLKKFARDDRDPGFFNSTGGLRGYRGDLYEGGIRAPFIARLPAAFMPGVTRDYAAAIWDVLPTLGELSGAINLPKHMDGVSIAPMLRGGIGEARKMLYWEVQRDGVGQAVRMGDWKVVRPPGKSRREDCELYNLKKDPKELRDISSRHPDIVARFVK